MNQKMPEGLRDWMGVTAAAAQLGMHRNSVLDAVREGRLLGYKIDGRVLVSRSAAAAYRKYRHVRKKVQR